MPLVVACYLHGQEGGLRYVVSCYGEAFWLHLLFQRKGGSFLVTLPSSDILRTAQINMKKQHSLFQQCPPWHISTNKPLLYYAIPCSWFWSGSWCIWEASRPRSKIQDPGSISCSLSSILILTWILVLVPQVLPGWDIILHTVILSIWPEKYVTYDTTWEYIKTLYIEFLNMI